MNRTWVFEGHAVTLEGIDFVDPRGPGTAGRARARREAGAPAHAGDHTGSVHSSFAWELGPGVTHDERGLAPL